MTATSNKPAPPATAKPSGKVKVTRNGDTVEIPADKLEHFIEFGWVKVA